mgnify:FL=1
MVRVPGAVMCYTWTMGIKKRTKPSVPGRKKAALNLAKTRLFRYRNKYATLWEAAKQYSKTKHFKVVARSAKKQMIKQHGEAYYQKFLKDKKRQIKFVLNLFREIKGDGKQYPKMLHQTEETGFTPPKEIIYGKADLAEKVLSKDWVNNMVSAMKKNEFVRWESGIRSKEYLNKIFEVCRLTPKTKHLLHTAETTVLKQIRPTDVPENMLIRLMLYQTTKGTTPNEIKWPWTFLVDERTEKERQEEEAEELKVTKKEEIKKKK